MPYLIQPTASDPALRASFFEAMREFETAGGCADAGGLSVADLETDDCMENYTAGLREGTSMRIGVELLRTSEWWWCEPAEDGLIYLGRASLRRHPAPKGGHLELAVRPSRRREGHGTALLAVILPIAHAYGIDPVLIVCEKGDVAARRLIEACGGILEHEGAELRRYRMAAST